MALKDTILRPQDVLTATIATGASLSGVAIVAGLRPHAVQIPATWTAANLTFQVASALTYAVDSDDLSGYDAGDDTSTWSNLYDAAGNEYVVVVSSAGSYIILDPAAFDTVRYLKIRSGTASVPVNQAETRVLTLIAR